jgi:peroxiredoxin
VFLGLAGRDTADEMSGFIDRHGLDGFDHLVDEDGTLWQRFGIARQPAWVFVNDDGTAKTVVGSLSADGLRAEIDRLVES